MSGAIPRKRDREDENPIIMETEKRIRLQEENHIYKFKANPNSDEEEDIKLSSSKVLDTLFPPFYPEETAAMIEKNAVEGRYGDLFYPEIRRRWNEGAVNGTEFHALIETYYKIDSAAALADWYAKSKTIKYNHLVDSFIEYATRMEKAGWRPYRSEEVIYDVSNAKYKYPPGTADMIYERVAAGKVERYLVDFKTAETEEDFIKKKSPVLASYPLAEVPNSKLYKGHVQCAVYSVLFARYFKEPIHRQAIVAFFWNDGENKHKVFLPDRSLLVDAALVIDQNLAQQQYFFEPLRNAVLTGVMTMQYMPTTLKPITK